jgi:hypothetical protein
VSKAIKEVLMPINKQKPSSNSKAAPGKKPGKSSELSDADLRSISGGMAARPGATDPTDPVCVSSSG